MKQSELEILCINALIKAYKKQLELRANNTINQRSNQGRGKDQALVGDWESEEVIISHLKQEGLPARVIAEEHGTIDLVREPSFLITIDGWDGSSALAKDPNSRGGTMISLSPNLNPRYEDFKFSGITEIATSRIVYAVKCQGAHLIKNPEQPQILKSISPKPRKQFTPDIKIDVDDTSLWDDERYEKGITAGLEEIGRIMHNTFTIPLRDRAQLRVQYSSAAMTLDILLGGEESVDAVAQIIAKGVFEPPVQYLLVREVEGAVLDMKGDDIGQQYWHTFGRNPISPIFLASSNQLGREIIDYLNKTKASSA